MKYSSFSTILGLAFGILLAFGVAVSAFQSPTQAPPGGNVPAPINTGTADQTKTGGLLNVFGLWVNQSLGVTGGATIGGGLSVSGSLTSSGQSVCLANGINCPPSGVPQGFVGFFNLASCPSSWTELTGAQGRYLVGLPSAGTLAGTVGTALNNLEDRIVGQHTHGINDLGHGHALTMRTHLRRPYDNDNQQFGSIGTDSSSSVPTTLSATGITINTAGTTAGTNAPYIQFLVCQKN